MQHAYLIAAQIGFVKIGAVLSTLPLHCTIMHWFRTHLESDQITGVVEEVCAKYKPIELHSMGFELFGKRDDVPVHTLAKNYELMSLHQALYSRLQALNVAFDEPDYVGPGYRPHVTNQKDETFPPGSRTTSHVLYIVEAHDSENLTHKRIFAKLQL